MRTASMPEYPEAPTTATLTLSCVATCGISMLLLLIGVEATELSELRAPSQLLGLELEEHVGGWMLGIGGKPFQVNPHRSIIRTRLAQPLEFRPRRRDVARPNL